MAKCTRCGAKAGFLMSLCIPCLDAMDAAARRQRLEQAARAQPARPTSREEPATPGGHLRGCGWTLLLLGIGGMGWALTLDTTVTAASYYSDLGNRWVFPTERYHNIGLLDEKQNYVITAGVVAVVGVLLVIVGRSRAPAEPTQPTSPAAPPPTKRCPDCAEMI